MQLTEEGVIDLEADVRGAISTERNTSGSFVSLCSHTYCSQLNF